MSVIRQLPSDERTASSRKKHVVGRPVTSFTQSELTDVLTSQTNLLYYAGESIGKRIRDEVLPRLLEYGLIEPSMMTLMNTWAGMKWRFSNTE